jgi:hypothetical protein
MLDCFTPFAMTAFWIPVIATRLQLRAQCGRGETDAAIQMPRHCEEARPTWQSRCFKQNASFIMLDCFTLFAMTAFWIPVIATRLQLRTKRGRGEAGAAIRNSRHCEKAKPTWQSRWFNKMHLCPAGLLHFVRNDGKGVMNSRVS